VAFTAKRRREDNLDIDREGAHPFSPLSRRGLDRVKLAYSKPVCHQSW